MPPSTAESVYGFLAAHCMLLEALVPLAKSSLTASDRVGRS